MNKFRTHVYDYGQCGTITFDAGRCLALASDVADEGVRTLSLKVAEAKYTVKENVANAVKSILFPAVSLWAEATSTR